MGWATRQPLHGLETGRDPCWGQPETRARWLTPPRHLCSHGNLKGLRGAWLNRLIILSGISEAAILAGPGVSRAAPAGAWRQEANPGVTPPPVGRLLPAVVCCRLTWPAANEVLPDTASACPGRQPCSWHAVGREPVAFSLTPCSASLSASGRRRQPERPEQSCACHPSCSPAARPGDAETASAPCSCLDEVLGQAKETLLSPSSPPPALRVSPGCWWQLPG